MKLSQCVLDGPDPFQSPFLELGYLLWHLMLFSLSSFILQCEQIWWWQEYTELYKKHLHDPDNHDGMITHLEPDILKCKVKWALGSITMNKANGGDGIPVELFQVLKDDAMRVLHSTCQQIYKSQQWSWGW